jgi:hypothetical protein
MPTPYDRLREKINQMFPERMELKFGCEFTNGDGIYRIVHDDAPKNVWRTSSLKNPNHGIGFCSKDQFCKHKILGTPVTMDEVLMALNGCLQAKTFRLECNGDLYQINYKEGKYGWFEDGKPVLVCELPLSLPVSEWPDETIDAVLKLIE